MSFAGISYSAVVAAAAASFLFGGLWYGIFSKTWMAAANVSADSMKTANSAGFIAPYVIAFVGQLVMAFFLAGLLGHLGEGLSVKNGLLAGASVWLGFVFSAMCVNHAFQGAKKELTLIDGGHWLGVLLLQGAIIGYLGLT